MFACHMKNRLDGKVLKKFLNSFVRAILDLLWDDKQKLETENHLSIGQKHARPVAAAIEH